MVKEIVLMRLPQFRGFLKSEKMKSVYNIADGLVDSEIESISTYHDGKNGFFIPFSKIDNENEDILMVICGDKMVDLVSVMRGIESLMLISNCFEEQKEEIEITTDFVKEVDKEGIEELFKIYFPKSFNKFIW